MIDKIRSKILREIVQELEFCKASIKKLDFKSVTKGFDGDIDFFANAKDDRLIKTVIENYCLKSNLKLNVVEHVSLQNALSKKYIVYQDVENAAPLQLDVNFSFHWLCFELIKFEEVPDQLSYQQAAEIKKRIKALKNYFYKKNLSAEISQNYSFMDKTSFIFRLINAFRLGTFRYRSVFFLVRNGLRKCLIARKRSQTIAFYGTDGAGKSTLINMVRKDPTIKCLYDEIMVFHTRPSILPSISRLMRRKPKPYSNKRENKQYNYFKSYLVLIYFSFDYFIYNLIKITTFSKKKRLIIFDRYFLEYIYQPSFAKISPLVVYNLNKLFDQPDWQYYLTGDEKIIAKRKNEVSEQFIKEQNLSFTSYLQKFGTSETKYLNTTKQKQNECLEIILGDIIRYDRKFT